MFRILIKSNRLLNLNSSNFNVFENITSRMNSSTLASGKVLVSQREGVLTITFNNERVKNATDIEIYDAISGKLNAVANDESVKMVMFTGKGEYYSSGININSFKPMFSSSEKQSFAVKVNKSVEAFVAAFIDFPKPLIAAVNGPALGLQVTTLALKDFIVCSDTATFQTPFSKIGVTAEGCSSQLFPAVFGVSRANSMLMFSEKITATEALNAGFVSKVIPKKRFEEEVDELIYGESGILKSYSYPSILGVKKLTKNDEWKQRMHAANKAECEELLKLWSGSEFEKRIMSFFDRKRLKEEKR